jgi:hypothetical protein
VLPLNRVPRVSGAGPTFDRKVPIAALCSPCARLEDGAEIPHHEKRVGRDGVKQPTSKPTVSRIHLPGDDGKAAIKRRPPSSMLPSAPLAAPSRPATMPTPLRAEAGPAALWEANGVLAAADMRRRSSRGCPDPTTRPPRPPGSPPGPITSRTFQRCRTDAPRLLIAARPQSAHRPWMASRATRPASKERGAFSCRRNPT